MSKQTYTGPLSFNEILKLVKSLSIEDKVRIEEEIGKETLLFRAQKLDDKIPENSIDMEDIVHQIQAYRKSSNDKQDRFR
ncbi:MAG: hypothetical protein ACOC2E_05945 [Bacteroidota bacterium]